MPTLIEKYEKNLDACNSDNYDVVTSLKFIHNPSMNAFEIALSDKKDPLDFSGAVLVWHYPYPQIGEQWVADHISAQPKNLSSKQIFDELNKLVSLDAAPKRLIGAICYKEYKFIPEKSGVQICSAYIDPDLQQFGLATTVYKFLAEHKNIVVSDYMQTPYAQKLWSNSLPRVGKVSVFNEIDKTFISDIDANECIDSVVWGISSGAENYESIKHLAETSGMEGYKVDQDCHRILLTFSIK